MIERPVALIVHQSGTCPLLKAGERWVVSAREVHMPPNVTKVCGYGMCSVFLKLHDILRSFPANAGLPDDYLLCDVPGCDAAFRMEFTTVPSVVVVAAASAARLASVRMANNPAPAMIPAPAGMAPAPQPSSASQRGAKTTFIFANSSFGDSGAVAVSAQPQPPPAASQNPADTVITHTAVAPASPAATLKTPLPDFAEPPAPPAPSVPPSPPAPAAPPAPPAPAAPAPLPPVAMVQEPASPPSPPVAAPSLPVVSAPIPVPQEGPVVPKSPEPATVIMAPPELPAATPAPRAPAPTGEPFVGLPPPVHQPPSLEVQRGITNILAPNVSAASDPGKSFTRRIDRGREAATAVLKTAGPFLSRLPKELAAELVISCATGRFQRGEVILQQGVAGEHLYIVAEGNVEVVKRAGENETVLVTLGVGDCFGEMSILTGEVTSAEVRSAGQAAVLSLEREKLEALLLKRPLLSREFSKLLAERLKASNVSLQSELSRGILGKLSMISLLDLVQTLQQSRRTGTLVLSASGEQAHLGFHNGTLSTAVCGEVVSDEAFFKVVCWPDGDFCFESMEPPTDDAVKVKRDTMGLMMEGMRLMDESRAALAGPKLD